MNSLKRALCIAGLFSLACAGGSGSGGGGGCRGEEINFDCDNQKREFEDRAAEEEEGLGEIPSEGPYPVAIQLTEEALNRLVESVLSEDVPFRGVVPFGVLPQGPGEAAFESAGEPVIELVDVPGCPECVIVYVDFGVQLDSSGEPLSSGVGWVQMAVPLSFEVDEATGVSRVIADYPSTTIHDWYLSVFGFDSETHKTLSGALRLLMEEQIQEEGERLQLLEIGSWGIGNDEVRLAARELIVIPEQKKLALGMHTNIPLPDTVGLDLNLPLEPDAPMQVSFDTGLMLEMMHRMLEEGEIPRVYNEDGQPDPEGIYGVTLRTIKAAEGDPHRLDVEFLIWRTDDGYCGAVAVAMPLTLGVNTAMTGLEVSPGTAVIIEGDPENVGVGVAAEEEKRIVDENQNLVDVFREELAEEVANTINYEELGVEGSRVIFSTLDVRAAPAQINTLIDFLVVAEPGAEDDGGSDGGGSGG